MSERARGAMPESSLLPDVEKRGPSSEFPGRFAAAAGLTALFFAVWLAYLPGAADWTNRIGKIVPRLSVFGLSIFAAFTLQGCWLRSRALMFGTLLFVLGMVCLHGTAEQFEIVKLDPDMIGSNLLKSRSWFRADGRVYFHARIDLLQPGTVLLLMRFECALFAAVFLGTWIGRGAWSAWHFVALLWFGAVCDIWTNWFHVADVTPSAFEAALRMPFTPALGGLSGGPGFLDVVFASAVFESGRAFRMHSLALGLCALAGYCSGSFLSLEPAHLSMALMAFGVMVAAWPELKLDSNSVGKMFLSVALLILALALATKLQRSLNAPPARPREEIYRARDLAGRPCDDEIFRIAGHQNASEWEGPAELARPLHLTLLEIVPMNAWIEAWGISARHNDRMGKKDSASLFKDEGNSYAIV